MKKKLTLFLKIINLIIIILNTNNYVFALEKDSSKPIHITSDLFNANFNKHIAVYTGNVIATQGTRKLTGDTANIYGDKNNQVIKIIITGKPAKYSYQPKPNDKLTHASGDKIIYEPPKNLFTIIGNAYIEQNNNVYKGHKLIYNTEDETIVSPARQFKRGEMTLQPEVFKTNKTKTKTQTQVQTQNTNNPINNSNTKA